MQNDFHAVDAAVAALRGGITSFGIMLRLGWLPLVIIAATTLFLVNSGAAVNFGGPYGGAGESIQLGVSGGFLVVADEWTFPIGLASGVLLLGAVLFVPALVGVTRRAAGRDVRRGFLPVFGREEVAYAVAFLIVIAVLLLTVLLLFIPFSILGVAADGEASWFIPVAGLLGLAVAPVLIWVGVRISLLPSYAALTGRFDPAEGVKLTRGHFWKLFGAYLLTLIALFAISLGAGLLGVALTTIGGVVLGAILNAVHQLYQNVVNAYLTGRIAGDLLGQPSA